MHFDLMTGNLTWQESATLARDVEAAGFSGMLFTETSQVPWMMIAAAATAAPRLELSTGIAVAFPRSPMIAAQIAWELARNTNGRFRLGLGSQVRAHVTRRYASDFDRPAARMRDYVQAVKASLAAFRGDARLDHSGPFYSLNLLRPEWIPPRHDHGDIKVDISAVGPLMCQVADEVADGVHVHPMHSMHYIESRLRPSLSKGAAKANRDPGAIDLSTSTGEDAMSRPQDGEHVLQLSDRLPDHEPGLGLILFRIPTGQLLPGSTDRIALIVEQGSDAPNEQNLMLLVVAPVAPSLHRLQIVEFLLPIAQDVGLHVA